MQLRRLSLVTSAIIIGLSSLSFAATPDKAAAPALSRSDVETIVKEYILNNPEVILQAVSSFKKKEMEESQAKAEKLIKEKGGDIYNDPDAGSIGPANADVTIVEFFDYHCGYCKHFLPVINQLTKEDPKLRVVFKELPILSEDSHIAAKAALAVNKVDPKKYFAFHSALMESKAQSFSEASLTEVAKSVGVDEEKFKQAMQNPKLEEIITKNLELARSLSIQGTPSVIANGQLIQGAASLEDLKEAIKDQREGKTSAKPADKKAKH